MILPPFALVTVVLLAVAACRPEAPPRPYVL